MFENLIIKLENIKRIVKTKDEPVYRTSKLLICDVRTLLKRNGRMSVSSTEPNLTVCRTDDRFSYVDVFTGEIYPCADIARMTGQKGDKYVLYSKKLSKDTIKTMPFMTLIDIRVELNIENDFHNDFYDNQYDD